MSLESIIDNGIYPIVFIGSGMSKRYIGQFPTWETLLEEYWKQINESQNFWSYLRSIKNGAGAGLTKDQRTFVANTQAATKIQHEFDDLFFDLKITVPDLSIDQAYHDEISPFKFSLSRRFIDYKNKLTDAAKKEIEAYTTFLSKARVIVTTNYDTLIEDQLTSINKTPQKYVRNQGFFDETINWGELYKIHGDVSDPQSIVINENDYKKYDQDSILVTAKLLTNMINNPIIFLGYSLSDRNVRNLLKQFSSQLPSEDIRKSADRITIVEYKEGEDSIEGSISRNDELGINYNYIQTDNYKQIFEDLSKIDEGLSPYEVLKFQKAIKRIVVTAEKKGSLDTVLVSLPGQVDNAEAQMTKGKRLVVALGDTKNIFVNPSPATYLEDYVLEKDELYPEVGLRFIARTHANARYPFNKYVNDLDLNSIELENFEKVVINKKINVERQSDLAAQRAAINKSNQIICKSMTEILQNYSAAKMLDVISYNAVTLPFQEVDKYVKQIALPTYLTLYHNHMINSTNEGTAYKRLFLMWDILRYGKNKARIAVQ